ncbi:MAG: hypothetical protein ACOY94_26880 [Bacillota bacterium]
MMHGHREAPDTRLERYLLIALLIAILLGADRLVLLIYSDLERVHTAEFIGLALLAALALYLLLLLLSLATVRYTLTDDGQLVLRQGLRRVVIELSGEVHLHRWRSRWGWSGGATRDLGVDEIDLFPPLWLFRGAGAWVVIGRTPKGARRAVALRPSPRLLSLLKEHVPERWGVGD